MSLALFSAILLGSAGTAVAAGAAAGAGLSQVSGAAGCLSSSQGGGEGCREGTGLNQASGVATSPDGKSVYVASYGSNSLTVFDRNPETGALEQKPGAAGCIATEGESPYAEGRGLEEAVAVSPDGKNVYVAAYFGSVFIAILDRDPATGEISQSQADEGCVALHGSKEGFPDRTRYVASSGCGAVAIFDRAGH